jgi:uncharacterized protein HemX
MDMRVFWAVLAALGVAGVVVLGFQRYREYQAALMLQEALQQLATIPAQLQHQAAAATEEQRRLQKALRFQDAMARMLAENERCIGGTVRCLAHDVESQVEGR